MRKRIFRILCGLSHFFGDHVLAQNVSTQHNDLGRTGWYPNETILNTSNVNQNTFGLSFNYTVDDKIFAQPLVIQNVNIPGKGIKNIVFAATVNNTIYAFDADVATPVYWSKNFSAALPGGGSCGTCRPPVSNEIHPSLCGGGYTDFNGNMGLVATPVIDEGTNTMYFVVKVSNPSEPGYDNHGYSGNFAEYTYTSSGFHQYLHAIDITTGDERPNSPVEITAIATGTGDGQVGGVLTFDPRRQFVRAGLAFKSGKVYVAYAAHCDFNPCHGWVMKFDGGTLTREAAFNTTPNDGRGGIWMSGMAPALDAAGNIYFAAGNSLNEDGPPSNDYNKFNSDPNAPANRGESIIKLDANLNLTDWFTPFNYLALNDADKDFGTQVMLLPNTGLGMTGCKDDSLYIFDQNNLTHFDPNKNNTTQRIFVQNDATMHSTFAYFGGPVPYAYQYSENTQIKAYPVSGAGLGNPTTNTTIVGGNGSVGGFMSVSSNGADPNSGILWVYQADYGCDANSDPCHATLHALNASDVTTELWNSSMLPADDIPVYNKMSCPTIALGKVFVGANTNHVYVFGLKTNTTCINNVAIGKLATAGSSQGANLPSAAIDGNTTSSWTSGNASDTDSITVDLGVSYDICNINLVWDALGFAKDFNLKISSNNISYTTINSVTGNTALNNTFSTPVVARYVRMSGVTRGAGINNYSISEFQIFGSPSSATCNPPSNLTAVSGAVDYSEDLSWDAVGNATTYYIKYRPNLSTSWIYRTSTTNTIHIGALSCGTLYYYTVQSDCGSGKSAESNGSFTTANCPGGTGCDILPTRYYNVDLGDIGVAGNTCFTSASRIFNLSGSGDVASDSDQFQFAYTTLDIADYDVTGRIIEHDPVNISSKTGIMVRDSLTTTSRFAYLAYMNNKFIFTYRAAPSDPVLTVTAPGTYSLPYWMKIAKAGTTYEAMISPDGSNWTSFAGPFNLNFGNSATNSPRYGIAVASASMTTLSTGKIDNFTLVSNISLPINLVSFDAKNINDDHVLVSWTTSMEHLVDYYQVERSPDDFATFESIGQVNAAGDSESIQNYTLIDNHPTPGVNYYRLMEVDKNGNHYYSSIISVNFAEAEGLKIKPNPAVDNTTISAGNELLEVVKIFDATGKLVRTVIPPNNSSEYLLNVLGLPKGIYVLQVQTTKGTIYRSKFVKG